MDQEIKQKWVKALRSGEYEQGQGWLRTESNQFCCLGVFCDIINPIHWIKAKDRYLYKNCAAKLPIEFLDMFKSGQEDALIKMNDGGLSFKEIARWIEENL